MSGRALDAAMATAAGAAVVRPLFLVRLGYDGADALYAGAPFDVGYDWDGDEVVETFKGVGDLGRIGAVEEGIELQPYALDLTLTGIDPDTIAAAMLVGYQGRPVIIWLALLDGDGAFIGEPVRLWSGRMDTQDIELGETATITVRAVSRFANWQLGEARRYSPQYQRVRHPGDKGLDFAPQQAELRLPWGRAS